MYEPRSPIVAFKTAAPSLDGAVARPPLLARLRAMRAPARWVSAPSGAGKSTLVAQYAASLGIPLVWYRLDARDDDTAFFYGELGRTLSHALRHGPGLPVFRADDRADEHAFAQRFAQAAHRRARAGAILVIDDAHAVQQAGVLQALAALAGVADAAFGVVIVGEALPPAQFFDLVTDRQLGLCGDLPLAFAPDECRALARSAGLQEEVGDRLAQISGGHAGALVLACELVRHAPAGTAEHVPTADQVHQHLLGRLLAKMSPARRALLLRTGHARQFTRAMAVELAGPAPAAELDALVGRGLLRRIESSDGEVFEAHGLVRRGMRAAIAAGGAPDDAPSLADTAAVMRRHGFDEDAFALLVTAGAFEAAAEILSPLARRYAKHGQSDLLLGALSALPATACDDRPWLCYRAGQALLGVDEEGARRWFARCYAGFQRAGDRPGMRLAAASVVTAFGLEYGDLRELDAWLARHAESGGDEPVAPGAAHESTLHLGALCAALMRGAHAPGVDSEAIVRRMRVLVEDDEAWESRDEPLAAARVLIDHARVFGSPEHGQALVIGTHARAGHVEASPLQRGRWCIAAAQIYFNDRQHEKADEYLAAARELMAQGGSKRLAFELGMAQVDALLKRGDLPGATAELSRLETIARQAPPAQRAEHARITARVLLMQGRSSEGLRWATDALDTAALAGYSGAHKRQYQVECIYALAANERLADAHALALTLPADMDGSQRAISDAIIAATGFLAGGEEDVALLERAMALAEDCGFVNLLMRARAPLARLCRSALARGVRPAFARRLIAQHGLAPAPNAGPEWPWPVVVRTLGRFELEIRGARYRPGHKTQEKPLELLKLLVVCQALGRDSADRGWIAERLWPDADEPNARKSLEMALSRLRKLLRHDEAVVLSEGRLMLSPTHVWNDVRPLMAALRHAGVRRDEHARASSAAPGDVVGDIAAVLSLYGGTFLPGEGDAPWLIAGREAVQSAVRGALLIAEAVLAGRDDARLIPAFERAFAADPTSEDLARALMRALARQGDPAEAVRVYRRLREMLSVMLSLAPSRETDALRATIYATATPGSARLDADLPRTDART